MFGLLLFLRFVVRIWLYLVGWKFLNLMVILGWDFLYLLKMVFYFGEDDVC